MMRRVIGEQVEITYDATECVICIQDPRCILDEDAESSSVRLSLAELDALIETLTQARQEADPALWQANTLIRVNTL